MGRKKRSAATANDGAAAVLGQSSLSSSFPPPLPLPPPMMMGMPPPPMMTMASVAYDQYGRPAMPPPPPAMMMMNAPPPPPPPSSVGAPPLPASKRSRPSDDVDPDVDQDDVDIERKSYPVKKYRPDSYYRSIEAFARYTKSHRMLDAAYVKWTSGAGSTPDKPHVFGIRIAGSYLSWGRGRTRDAAIDAAVRAAFHLVAAHGYDDFAMTEDCFTEEPYDEPILAPMPPPPPPPPIGSYGGHMNMGMMMPPLPPGGPPPGMPPNFGHQPPIPGLSMFGGANTNIPPPAAAVVDDSLIPQPAAPCANLAIASTVSNAASATEGGGGGGGGVTATIGISVSTIAAAASTTTTTTTTTTSTTTSKGLVYSGMSIDEYGDEMSMEETRMRMPRYWTSIVRGH